MMDLQHRRTFLRAAMAAGAAWAAADVSQVEAALAWAADQAQHHQAKAGAHTGTEVTSGRDALKALTKDQADVVEAVTARILPAVDGRPGAREAGAMYFIDRALATFNSAQKALYVDGIANLNQRASGNFAALAPARQDDMLREIESTPFFQTIRFDTLVGTFALPSWGGNRDFAGWRLIGVDHQPFFQAPFGHYDANANGKA